MVSPTRFRFQGLKVKLLSSVIALCAFFCLIALANSLVATYMVRRMTEESLTGSVERTRDYVSLLLRKGRDLAFALCTNTNLAQLCTAIPEIRESYYRQYDLFDGLGKDLTYQTAMNDEMLYIAAYLEAWGKALTSGGGVASWDVLSGSAWFSEAMSERGRAGWWAAFRDSGRSGTYMVAFFCRADLINRNLKSRAFLSVNYEARSLIAILRGLKITPGTSVFLVDSSGIVACAEDESLCGSPVTGLSAGDWQRLRDGGSSRVRLADGRPDFRLGVFRALPLSGFGILALVPEAELLAPQRIFLAASMALILLLVGLMILLSWKALIRQVDAPVAKLVRHMEEAEKGNFDLEIAEDRLDEFGLLFRSYNATMRKIKLLIRELYQEKLLKREIELKVLQNQINPHFLYNTLDTINWIATRNGVSDISRIVISLSTLYRASFNRGRDHIEVRDMLRSMEGYLFIEKFRYKDLSEYQFQVDPRTHDFLVLNLILQPLVENAVIHGIGDLGRPGLIVVSCSLEGHCIRLEVEDNGRGMPAGKLALLRESLEGRGTSDDSGLRNVAQRIRLFYGEAGSFSVESLPDRGTRVAMVLPVSCPLKLPVLGG